MRKTYITKTPDQAGAFLQEALCYASSDAACGSGHDTQFIL